MMMKKLYKQMSLTALALLLCTSLALAQERSVSGTVTDETGQPLPGVNVLVKGTSQGTVTDVSGNFSVGGVDDNSTLVFSFIGYTAKEVVVGSQSSISVALTPDVRSLEEVVVIGYGEQKKSLVTGAISSVKADELKTVSVGAVDQAMQGRTAGVQIAPTSGQPGSGTRIRIRGLGSNGDANPLFIIDGVRTSTDGMNYLNPNDIASIEVLKDAASAAIYGAEGANGVVIITTKAGKKNTSEITYNGQYTSQSVRNGGIDLMNARQYQTYLTEAGLTPGSEIPTNAEVNANPEGTDWQDVAFSSAPIHNHSINFTGGTDKSNLFVSAGYFSQKGIAGGDKSKFERYSIRVNSNHKVKDWLNIGENFAYTKIQSAGLAVNTEFGGVMSSILSLPPSTPAYFQGDLPQYFVDQLADEPGGPYNVTRDANGRIYGLSQWLTGEYGNPLAIYENQHGGSNQNKILGNVYVEITPIENLKLTSRVGVDAAFQRSTFWTPNYWYSTEAKNAVSRGGQDWDEWYTAQWENFATYNKQIGDHNLSVTAGQAILKYQHNWLNGRYAGMFQEEDEWQYPDYIPDADDRVGGSREFSTLSSYFGRVSYDFNDRYLANFSLRSDGSSKLAEGHQRGLFPAASVGWVFSNEEFFGGAANIVNYAKIRASWGQNGSLSRLGSGGTWRNSISTTYSSPYFGSAQPIRYLTDQGTYLVGAAPTRLANPLLTWETSEQLDIGLDLRFIDERLSVSLDYFDKVTKDLLAPGNAPRFAGASIDAINVGAVGNRGFEIEAAFRSNESDGGLRYEISGNFTSIKNEVRELYAGATAPGAGSVGTHWGQATRFIEGQPMWAFYGYKTTGIFQNQEEINSYMAANGLEPSTTYDPRPGDPIVVNVNGDDQINSGDYTQIGQPHPTFYYGGRVNLFYKGFDLLVFAQGQGGNDIIMGYFRTDRGTANKPEFFFTDRWTGEGSTNDFFRASYEGPGFSSDMMVAKGDFLKIRQLQLGYTIPTSLSETLRIKSLRVYVSLDDYFVFTKYKGFDPEIGASGFNTLGIDRGSYPFPRKVVGGVTLTF